MIETQGREVFTVTGRDQRPIVLTDRDAAVQVHVGLCRSRPRKHLDGEKATLRASLRVVREDDE